MILHIMKSSTWEERKNKDFWGKRNIDAEGFIHCSRPEFFWRVAPNFDGIEDELKKNKVKIRRLTNDVRVEKEDISSEYKQLNYVEELKKLKEYLELWYVSGANQKKFLEYIEDDSLEDEICEDFSDTEIKTIKRILTDRSKKRY